MSAFRLSRVLAIASVWFIFAAVLGTAHAHPTTDKQKKAPDPVKSLEEQLLDDLEADLLDDEALLDESEDEGQKKNSQSEADGEKGTDKSDNTAPAGESKDDLRDILERDLDDGSDAELTPEEDPISKIGQKMRSAESRLAQSDLSDDTRQLQTEIIKDIDKLLDELRKMMQQQQQMSQSKSSRQQVAQRKPLRLPTRRPGEPKTRDSKNPARDSQSGVRDAKDAKVDMREMDDLMKELSKMMLPDKAREQMRQGAVEKFLPRYEPLIERYLRRLAEEEAEVSP